ncbi:MAG: MFS transporter [Betaproteobacteria bacterium]
MWVLSIAQLITWGSIFYGFALFMVPLEKALGMTRAQSSLGFSLMLLTEGLLAFFIGRWIDRGYERFIMTAGSLMVGLLILAHSVITSMTQFYVIWTLLGVAMACTLYPPAFAVLTRRFPNHFRRAIIILSFLGGLASTVFIPLVAWLMDAIDWRETMWVIAALHLLVCAPIHFYLLRGAKSIPITSIKVDGNSNSKEKSIATHTIVAHLSLLQFMRNPVFWQLSCFVVLLMAATSALPAHMVSLLRESGLGETWAIAVPASIGVLQVIGRLGLYVLEHRINVHTSNRWVTVLIPLGLLALILGHGEVFGCLVFVVLYGLGNGMLTIVKGTVMAEYVSKAHMGSLNGILGVPMAVARAAAPLLMGLMWSPSDGYTYGLWMLLIVSVIGVGALWSAQNNAQKI